jgi:hypothetical protein
LLTLLLFCAVAVLYYEVALLYCAVALLDCAVAVLYCAVAVLYCAVAVVYCRVALLYCAVAPVHCALALLYCAVALLAHTNSPCSLCYHTIFVNLRGDSGWEVSPQQGLFQNTGQHGYSESGVCTHNLRIQVVEELMTLGHIV